MRDIRPLIVEVLQETAQHLLAPQSQPSLTIGLTAVGSEHGYAEVLAGAELAQRSLPGVEVLVIGPEETVTTLPTAPASTEEEAHGVMERMLDAGELHAAVTMHYSFPLGVATVGLVSTPGRGRPMFLACTTGMSATDRVEGMTYNAVYGISAAKAYGIADPSVGILNIDGARPVERALLALKAQRVRRDPRDLGALRPGHGHARQRPPGRNPGRHGLRQPHGQSADETLVSLHHRRRL